MPKRITQQRLESYLWDAATLLRGTIDAGDYKQFIFPLLFFKRLCDVFDEETKLALKESGGDADFAAYPEFHRFQVPQQAHWFEVRQTSNNVGKALQSAMRAIEKANPDKLFGIFGDAQWSNKDRLPDSMLRDLVEHFSCLELTVANLPEDELGQGYEYLIKKFADDSGHTAAEFYTNRTVVHLMTEMLEPQSGESIYDPTCGSGGMLLSCITHLRRQNKEWRNVRLYGQERNLMTSSIARMNCFLHGIEDFQIVRGDTLSEPKLVEGDRLMHFDVVLANPPYSIKQWDRDAFASDPWGRNLYGTPPQGRADYAFWQHVLQSLDPRTGRCAILFPHGVLFRQEESEMRRKLIEADVIECVLGLGPNLFYNSPMEACVVICRTNKPKARRGRIQFINAVNEITRERAQSFLTDDHVQHIVDTYEGFKDESGFARLATIKEVRDKDFNLSIPLFVEAGPTIGTNTALKASSLLGALKAWLTSSESTAAALKTILPNIELLEDQNGLHGNDMCKLLRGKSSWTPVRFGNVVENVNETESDPNGAGIERFIGLEHLEPGSLHIQTWGDSAEGTTFTRRCRPGQVLFGKRRAYQRKVALAEFDAVISGDIYAFAPKDDRLLPELLPFLCQSERFFKYALETSAGSLSPRTNWSRLSEFEFNLPPIGEQKRIAEILWAFDEVVAYKRLLSKSLKGFHKSKVDDWCGHQTKRLPLGQLITHASDGPFGSKLKSEHYSDSGARVIRLQNIGEGYFNDTDKAFIPMSYFRELKHYHVQSGDVIIAGLGDETHPVGRAALIPEAVTPAVNKADCFCLRADNRAILNSYLAYYLNSGPGMHQVAALSQGTTRLRINVGNIKKVLIPILPTDQQQEMVSELCQIELAMAQCQGYLLRASTVADRILNTFFGEEA